jgi:hypothetical protein
MTRLITRDGHSAVHGLAMRTGCSCPDCGNCAPRRVTAFEEDLYDEDAIDEDADYALRRAAATVRRAAQRAVATVRSAVSRPAPRVAPARRVQRVAAAATRQTRRATTRHPFRQPAALTPAQRSALNQTVTAFGWTGFRPTPGRAVNMQQLAEFQAAGGVAQQTVRGRRQMGLTPQGQRLLQSPRFRHLAPLFAARPKGQQRIYEIAPAGQLDRPNYIGKTGRLPGERLLEHLAWGSDRAHRELVDAQRQGRLSQLQVADGEFTVPDRGRRSHLGEVALMELTNPDWNDPSRHGFDAESPQFDW